VPLTPDYQVISTISFGRLLSNEMTFSYERAIMLCNI